MQKLFIQLLAAPRWVVMLLDFLITVASFSLSYFIVKQFQFSGIAWMDFIIYTATYCTLAVGVYFSLRIHTGLIRYSNLHDMVRIFLAVLVTSLLFPVISALVIAWQLNIQSLNIPVVLVVNFFIATSMLVMMRVLVKTGYHLVRNLSSTGKEHVLVYGTDTAALLVKQAIESNFTNQFKIAGFIQNGDSMAHSSIQQVKVYNIIDLLSLKAKLQVTKLVMMNDQLGSTEKKHVIDECLQVGIKVLTVPTLDQWISGGLNQRHIRELKIENLLQRAPISIDNENISKELCGKRILVTGAAGSIGGEIVRQVLGYHPEMVILCDQAESPLHEMQLEIAENFPAARVKIFIGSIRDKNRMEIPFREYQPQIVFHAAAYKHVPMMEHHPSEAILTNVLGTKNMADLSVCFHVHRFVMISSDKAVNPSNVMGTSKRIAEMYVQSLSNIVQNKSAEEILNIYDTWSRHFIFNARRSQTKFITTRFGNVLDSNGSVIPRFRAQIVAGGPVTVTHPEVTRFFMTIPEAVQLVLEAAAMGRGAEIFVFDMGQPVKIIDIANRMIRLAGLSPETDIKVVYTGLRPGEKLYEELLHMAEKTLPTHHDKIKIAKVVSCSHEVVMDIEELIHVSRHGNDYSIVKKMKQLVPEFKSNNSEFEKLDGVREETYTHRKMNNRVPGLQY